MSRLRVVPLTLRGRLLWGLLALVTIGLLGTDVAAYSMMRSFLRQRVDHQLTRAGSLVDVVLGRRVPAQPTGALLGVSGSASVLFLDPNGRMLSTLPTDPAQREQADLVEGFDEGTLGLLRAHPNRPTALTLGGAPYRGIYHPTHGAIGGRGGGEVSAVVIALSVADDQDTLDQLVASEAIVSTVALLVLAGLAVGVLRLGLRPLDTMAATATAIAEGDPGRRVPILHPRTEVGQLGAALNRAFDERRLAEERLRRFVADAGHELRTPLTTIRGWADLYFQDGLNASEAVETAMTRIAEAAGHMGRLVEELLLLARLDEQRPLDSVDVELGALVGEVIADARVVDPGRPITFEPPPGATTVVGDADRLRQVVRNLVGNALQHTPPGTPVRVRLCRERTADGAVVRLGVADEGPGIAEEDQEHLFERFYRADPSRSHTGHGAGLGLGLAIVRAVVDAHHGDVRVRSRPGEGTEFEVTLPYPAAAEVDA